MLSYNVVNANVIGVLSGINEIEQAQVKGFLTTRRELHIIVEE